MTTACFVSLGSLLGRYLTGPDLARRARKMPLLPDNLSVQDPLYLILWSLAGLSVSAMVALMPRDPYGGARNTRQP